MQIINVKRGDTFVAECRRYLIDNSPFDLSGYEIAWRAKNADGDVLFDASIGNGIEFDNAALGEYHIEIDIPEDAKLGTYISDVHYKKDGVTSSTENVTIQVLESI